MFKPSAQHSAYICALYKRCLSEGIAFFDDRTRTYIVNRTRKLFREYKKCKDETRIKSKILEARKRLHRLEKANKGDVRSSLKVLQAAYGQTGKVRHELLHAYLYQHFPADMKRPEPFVAHVPHTAPPPPLCCPLRTLVTMHIGKTLLPTLPVPEHKPLHPGRKANLLWRWRSMLVQRLQSPLPFEITCELERKAGATPDHPNYAANLMTGGPRWDDMYSGRESDLDLMHLCPNAILIPRSTLDRRQPLGRSPYEAPPSPYATLTMIHELDPTFEHHDTFTFPILKPQRRERRLYRKLLAPVPYLSPLPTSLTLWDETIKYTLTHSQWVPRMPTYVLNEDQVPDEEVVAKMKKHKKLQR